MGGLVEDTPVAFTDCFAEVSCGWRHTRRRAHDLQSMRYTIQVLSTLAACLSLTPLALAQTTTTGKTARAQSPAASDLYSGD